MGSEMCIRDRLYALLYEYEKKDFFHGLYGYENKEFFHCRINTQTILKIPHKLIGKECPTTAVLSCSSQETQRIASLHLAETLRRQRSPMTARSTPSSRASCCCPCDLASVVTVAAGTTWGEATPCYASHMVLVVLDGYENNGFFIVVLIPKLSLNFRTS